MDGFSCANAIAQALAYNACNIKHRIQLCLDSAIANTFEADPGENSIDAADQLSWRVRSATARAKSRFLRPRKIQ